MSATLIQYGLTNKRINREPIDAESVLTTYSELTSYCGTAPSNGHLYDGFITSIITSETKYSPEHYDSIPNYKVSYAGPWYIRNSYVGGKGSYTGDRILTNSEIKSYIGYVVTYIGTGGSTQTEYVKYVSTFQDVTGDAETLYYLDTEYGNYSIGFYRYKNNNFELIGGTNITWGNLT